jgi:hypothetical protein
MAHYDSYSKEQLIARIERLEANERRNSDSLKLWQESYADMQNQLKGLETRMRVLKSKHARVIAEKDAEIARLDRLVSPAIVATILQKAETVAA